MRLDIIILIAYFTSVAVMLYIISKSANAKIVEGNLLKPYIIEANESYVDLITDETVTVTKITNNLVYYTTEEHPISQLTVTSKDLFHKHHRSNI